MNKTCKGCEKCIRVYHYVCLPNNIPVSGKRCSDYEKRKGVPVDRLIKKYRGRK